MKEKYGINRSYFYADVWPVRDPLLYVFDPNVAQQLTVEHSTPKHPFLDEFITPITGKNSLVSSEGAEWKKWRSLLNPGFASGHLMSLVSGMVDDCVVFSGKLQAHAEKGDVFRLEEAATRLTVDIIGKVVMDINLDTQHGDNAMVTALREQVTLLSNERFLDPLAMWWPMGVYRRWRNDRIMNEFIGKVLDERFSRAESTPKDLVGDKKRRKRTVIDLALAGYQAEKGKVDTAPVMDAEFKKMACTQIRLFVFAGHDTTSSTLCYAYYMLQKHPECLAKIREEHDRVLGSIETAPQTIKNDPYVLNKLDYTMAVVKETLRLFPAASSTRTGEPGFMIRDPETGEAFPTEGFLVWIIHYALHRDKKTWGESANDFDPSRFLPQNEGKLPENGWRPFEKGARNCIGQELALLESRIALALTARSFDFDTALDSLDELQNDGSYFSKLKSLRKGVQVVEGEDMYQILIGTAKPREGRHNLGITYM